MSSTTATAAEANNSPCKGSDATNGSWSYGWVDYSDYKYDPDVPLAAGDAPDAELIALEAEINRFDNALKYLNRHKSYVAEDFENALGNSQLEMIQRMMAVPATTVRGRLAKTRVAFIHAVTWEFYDAAEGEEWGAKSILELLAEFCGISPVELASCCQFDLAECRSRKRLQN